MDYYTYRYNIKNVVLTLDTNYTISDGSVTYLFINNDYINRRLPVIKMNIELSTELIGKIYDAGDAALLKMDLYEQQVDAADNVLSTNLYWQHTFTIITAKDRTCYITSTDSATTAAVDAMKTLQELEIYLIDMTAVKWFTQQLCSIYKKASKPAVLQSLFQMRNIPNGITIATPPLDNAIQEHVVLPLGDLIGNINQLNVEYGLYDSYPIVFYDLMNLYCISKITPNIIISNAKDFGNIVLSLQNYTTSSRQVRGSYTDIANKTHYINLNESPAINDYTKQIGSTKFSTIASVNSSGTTDTTSVSAQTEDATALTYVYSKNSMTVDQLANEAMNGPQVTAIASNCAVSFLKPYKTITFQVGTEFTNLDLEGHNYRLQGWSLSITRNGTGAGATYLHDVQMNLIQPTLKDTTT